MHQIRQTVLVALMTVLLPYAWVQTAQAQSTSFVYPGIQTSSEAGLSQTNTVGTSSILWNPANIVLIPEARSEKSKKKRGSLYGVEIYGDLSIISVDYSYTRSGYDPVRLSLTAPPVTLGASWRPQSKFAFGAVFVPRPSTKAQTLPNVPIAQGSEVILVNAEALGSSVISGFGLGIKPNSRLSLGLSVIETAEVGKLSAVPVDSGDGETPLFQSSYEGSFFQYIVGGRVKVNDATVVAGSLKTSVVKKYTGDLSIAGGTPEATTRQGYAPMEIAVGFERELTDATIVGEYRRHAWAAGKSSVRAGTPGGAEAKDLQDVNIFIFGGRYQFSPDHIGNVAFGYYPANTGFGSALNPETGSAASGELVSGAEVADFDMLNRQVLAGGFKIHLKDSYAQAGFSIQNGSRQVPVGRPNEGAYSLSVYTIAIGGGKSF